MKPSEQMRRHLERERELRALPLAERVDELERRQMRARKSAAERRSGGSPLRTGSFGQPVDDRLATAGTAAPWVQPTRPPGRTPAWSEPRGRGR